MTVAEESVVADALKAVRQDLHHLYGIDEKALKQVETEREEGHHASGRTVKRRDGIR